MSQTEFGTGLIDDPDDYVGDGHFTVIGEDGPESFGGLAQFQRHDLNQLSTNACVWFRLKQTLWTLTGVHNIERLALSELAGYYSTLKRSASGGSIADIGCRPSVAAEVLSQQGFCLEDDWKFRTFNVLEEPPFQAFIEMSKHKWFFDRRVMQTGEALCRAVRVLGSRYVPPGFGLTVDDGFARWKPEYGPWQRVGAVKGRHMMTYHAHDTEGVWMIGSYGKGNAKNNTVLVSWDTIRSPETYPVMAPMIDADAVSKMLKKT